MHFYSILCLYSGNSSSDMPIRLRRLYWAMSYLFSYTKVIVFVVEEFCLLFCLMWIWMIWAVLLETVISHLWYADELGFLFLSFIVSWHSACQLFVCVLWCSYMRGTSQTSDVMCCSHESENGVSESFNEPEGKLLFRFRIVCSFRLRKHGWDCRYMNSFFLHWMINCCGFMFHYFLLVSLK